MPFDGKSPASFSATFSHRFDADCRRPTTQNNPLFGMDGAEWRGFFLGLTGMLAVVLGTAALVLATLGR